MPFARADSSRNAEVISWGADLQSDPGFPPKSADA
jgi:hypothetical protein